MEPKKLHKELFAVKESGDNNLSDSTSTSTHFFKEDKTKQFRRITGQEYLSISESISGTESYKCDHVLKEKKYTEKGLLKRNLIKNLDTIPIGNYY